MNKRFLLLVSACFALVAMADSKSDSANVILEPKGEARTYYMDNATYQSGFGFAMSGHRAQTLYFDGTDVYVPQPIDGVGVASYLKGTLDESAGVITFANKQPVWYYSNYGTCFYVCAADNEGFAGDTITNTFNEQPFQFSINSETNVISAPSGLVLGLYEDGDTKLAYGFTTLISFNPLSIDDSETTYEYTFVNEKTGAADTSTVKLVEGFESTVYLKGLNPKYPDTWVMGTKQSTGNIVISSNQVAKFYESTSAPIMYAASGSSDNLSFYNGFELTYDESANSYTAVDTIEMANLGYNSYGNLACYQLFSHMKLTHKDVTVAEPAAPTAIQFRQGSYTMIRVTLSDKDVDGNSLVTDNVSYRIYINGELYTFTTADYSKLSADMTDIAWAYDDYDNVSVSGLTRYIYFNNLPSDLQTIGVEEVYTVNGEEKVSQRLVYNVQTKTSEVVSGIETVEAPAPVVCPDAPRYNLAGRRVSNSYKGIVIVNGKKVLMK